MKKKLVALALVVSAGIYLLAGCSADRQTGASLGQCLRTPHRRPGDYEQVNLVVDQVSLHRDGDSTEAWETLKLDSTTTFDLIQLKGGVLARLADGDVPPGTTPRVRLHLADGSRPGGERNDLPAQGPERHARAATS